MGTRLRTLSAVLAVGLGGLNAAATEPATDSAIQRGRDAVHGRPALNPPIASLRASEVTWKLWGLPEKPADYARRFRDRYGLYEAPYENAGLPMGLHVAPGLLGKGVGTDCLLCHAGAVAGKTVIGMGNSAMDIESLFADLVAADNRSMDLGFRFSNVRGTIDPVSPLAFLMSFRDAELNVGKRVPYDVFKEVCSDPPAWWLLKKKGTRDWTGAVDARAARLDMVNLLSPFNSADFIKKQERLFADIHAFVMSVEAPPYPFAIDAPRAARGAGLFADHCASCHGTYGPKWTYPDKVVPIAKIGTDPLLAESFTARNLAHYNGSWFARETGPDGKPYLVLDRRGYQAPPLDGVWATAPYLHNGSAPTVYHVLNSKARPRYFTRTYGSAVEDYDPAKLGLRFTVLDRPADPKASGLERRKVYDTTLPGRANTGHTYGDDLTEEERMAVVEYLKTL